MNTASIINFYSFSILFIKEKFFSSLNSQEKKIGMIAIAVLSCFGAAYLLFRCFKKINVTPHDLKNQNKTPQNIPLQDLRNGVNFSLEEKEKENIENEVEEEIPSQPMEKKECDAVDIHSIPLTIESTKQGFQNVTIGSAQQVLNLKEICAMLADLVNKEIGEIHALVIYGDDFVRFNKNSAILRLNPQKLILVDAIIDHAPNSTEYPLLDDELWGTGKWLGKDYIIIGGNMHQWERTHVEQKPMQSVQSALDDPMPIEEKTQKPLHCVYIIPLKHPDHFIWDPK